MKRVIEKFEKAKAKEDIRKIINDCVLEYTSVYLT